MSYSQSECQQTINNWQETYMVPSNGNVYMQLSAVP